MCCGLTVMLRRVAMRCMNSKSVQMLSHTLLAVGCAMRERCIKLCMGTWPAGGHADLCICPRSNVWSGFARLAEAAATTKWSSGTIIQ